MNVVSHGRKLKLSALSLPLSVEDNPWFWGPVDASGLKPLLLTGYDNISHGLVCVMAERWHQETSSFHLSVGEMTDESIISVFNIIFESVLFGFKFTLFNIISFLNYFTSIASYYISGSNN